MSNLGWFYCWRILPTQKDIFAIFDVMGYEYRLKQDDFYKTNCLGDEQDCLLSKHNIEFVKDINNDHTPNTDY